MLPQPTKSSGSVPFIKMEEGQTRIRIVSEPIEEWTHFLEKDKKSVECMGNESGCQYCDFGAKQNHDYFFQAISRTEQIEKKEGDSYGKPEVKLVRFAPSLYGNYFELSQQPDWAFESIPNYDVIVTRTGKGLQTRYTITPCPAKELSDDDKEAIKAAKPLQEMVDESLGKDNKKTNFEPSGVKVEDIPF